MDTFPSGTASVLARCISAEVRARMAAQRITIRDFAARAGFASHNYPAKRNRDELPYTLDDLELICDLFDEEPADFVKTAWDNHSERIELELDDVNDGPAKRRALRAARTSADEPRLRAVAQEGEIEDPGEHDA